MVRGILSVLGICLIAAVTVTGTVITHNLKKTTRIVNGQQRTIEDLPHMVQIRDPMLGTFCSGTLISPQHVLTAAHCFTNNPYGHKQLVVVGGATSRTELGVERKVDSLSIHPEYETFYEAKGTDLEKQIGSKADVAVLKLDKPFEETKQIKVMKNFCPGPLSAKDTIEVAGWGHTKPIDPLSTEDIHWDFSEKLQSVRIPIISNEECSKKLSGDGFKLSGTNVCAYLKDHDSCISDSGGAAINRGQLCAVVSYGIGCAYGDYPGVYTSIHTVRNFIDEKIKD